MSDLDNVALQSLLHKLQSSSLEFNQQFGDETSEEATADVKHCYALFLELGDYLNNKMNIEISKNKNKENESQNYSIDATRKSYSSPDDEPKFDPEKCSKCDTKIEKADNNINKKKEHFDVKLNIDKGSQDTLSNPNTQGIKYPCNLCKFVSPNYIVLRGHMKLEHDKEEKKICIKCGFETADHKVFKKHLKIVHAKKMKITQYRKIDNQ